MIKIHFQNQRKKLVKDKKYLCASIKHRWQRWMLWEGGGDVLRILMGRAEALGDPDGEGRGLSYPIIGSLRVELFHWRPL